MQEHQPTIVHFSGHGTGEQGIVLEDLISKILQLGEAKLQDAV